MKAKLELLKLPAGFLRGKCGKNKKKILKGNQDNNIL